MKRLLVWLLAALVWVVAGAQPLQPVPALTARVIDQTGTLDAAQRQALEAKLAAFEQQKGSQIVVLMVATTQPEDIASYANRVGNAWKIGRRAVGDGILLIVAKGDRKVRIEVAKTLEGAVPDLAARRIIDDAITPHFRQGDYAAGLQAAADQLIARVSGEALPEPPQGSAGGGGTGGDSFDWMDLAIFLFLAVPIGARVLGGIFGRKLGAVVTGGGVGVVAWFVTASLLVAGVASVIGIVVALLFGASSSMVRGGRGGSWGGGGGGWSSGGSSSGGSWGSSDGGGFSSGGGGDFGGGGASGDW